MTSFFTHFLKFVLFVIVYVVVISMYSVGNEYVIIFSVRSGVFGFSPSGIIVRASVMESRVLLIVSLLFDVFWVDSMRFVVSVVMYRVLISMFGMFGFFIELYMLFSGSA